jgi:hypothetical protein
MGGSSRSRSSRTKSGLTRTRQDAKGGRGSGTDDAGHHSESGSASSHSQFPSFPPRPPRLRVPISSAGFRRFAAAPLRIGVGGFRLLLRESRYLDSYSCCEDSDHTGESLVTSTPNRRWGRFGERVPPCAATINGPCRRRRLLSTRCGDLSKPATGPSSPVKAEKHHRNAAGFDGSKRRRRGTALPTLESHTRRALGLGVRVRLRWPTGGPRAAIAGAGRWSVPGPRGCRRRPW